MELNTTIDGYKVSLDTDMDDDGEVSGCWIEDAKGHTASLECADATGVLNDGAREVGIAASTIARIRQWAEKNGY